MTLFPTTRWAEILGARSDPDRRRVLLGQLCADYRGPLLVLARASGLDGADAEDAVHGFLTRLLERDAVDHLDPSKGRLRSYLRTAMRHYLRDRHAATIATKRGGAAAAAIELETIADRVADATQPTLDEQFDRAFAIQVVTHTLDRLEAEFVSGRWSGPFAAVREHFALDAREPSSVRDETVAELAHRYAMTESQMTSFLHRARERFRRLLLHHVRELVADVADAEAELRGLLAAIGVRPTTIVRGRSTRG